LCKFKRENGLKLLPRIDYYVIQIYCKDNFVLKGKVVVRLLMYPLANSEGKNENKNAIKEFKRNAPVFH
jgi:hypothetical protein